MTASTLDPQREWIDRVSKIVHDNGAVNKKFLTGNLRHLWFRNPTNRSSLRLSSVGWQLFKTHAGVKFHEIVLEETVTGRQMLQLERLFNAPYYIKGAFNLHVVSEQDAIMLQLHAGNLAQYLNNLQM